jgi:hypothetical protein
LKLTSKPKPETSTAITNPMSNAAGRVTDVGEGSIEGDWIGVGVGSGDREGFHVPGITVMLLISKGAVSGYRSVKFP